jgi:hypothetical protein
VHTHNEKMLPRSYSIAGWQQWLCITVDTVWCITTTTGSEYTSRSPYGAGIAVPKSTRTPSTVGLILRKGVSFSLPPRSRATSGTRRGITLW